MERGTQGGTMKVPYAKKWQKETDNLRKIGRAWNFGAWDLLGELEKLISPQPTKS
jgi:hypothetical protein